MTIVKDIYDILTDIYGRIEKLSIKDDSLESIVQLLDHSYELLREIHTDYLEILTELRGYIGSGDGFSEATIDWLTKARVRRQVLRAELQSTPFFEITAKFKYSPARVKAKQRSSGQALFRYVDALHDYFGGPTDYTILSSFLAIFKIIVSLTQTPEELLLRHYGEIYNPEELSPVELISLENAEDYIERRKRLNKEASFGVVESNIDLYRLLSNFKIYPFYSPTEQQRTKMMDKLGLSFEQACRMPPALLEEVLLDYHLARYEEEVLQWQARHRTFQPDPEVPKLLSRARDHEITIENVVTCLLQKLNPDSRVLWNSIIRQRKSLNNAYYKKEFWISPVKNFVDNTIRTLEADFARISGFYQAFKFPTNE